MFLSSCCSDLSICCLCLRATHCSSSQKDDSELHCKTSGNRVSNNVADLMDVAAQLVVSQLVADVLKEEETNLVDDTDMIPIPQNTNESCTYRQSIVDNATSASHLINNGLLTFLSGDVVGGETFVEAVEAVNGELDVSALASDFEYDTDMDEDCSEGA